MKITMLVENTSADPRVKPKHGLSIYIETRRHKVQFDTAWDDLYRRNAEALGIDLREVDTLLLSHGHADHGKGLRDFLSFNKTLKVYVRKSAFDPHFIRVMGLKFSVGLERDLLADPRIIFAGDVHVIDDELLLFSDITERQLLSESNQKLCAREGRRIRQDDFSHEQSLLVTENEQSVLFSGCSHRGIYNIVQAAKGRCENFTACVGGFHLYNPPTRKYERPSLIGALASKLDETGVRYITCHCTGPKAFAAMQKIMGRKLSYLSAGESIEL